MHKAGSLDLEFIITRSSCATDLTEGHIPGDGQTTDPQSMDYPNGLPKRTTLKWTTPKNNIPNEYYLMFLAPSRLKLHIYKFRLCSFCTCGPLENRP